MHPEITWEVSDGSQWHAAAANYAFTADGQVSITLPDPLGQTPVNGQQGYWLRARLTGGSYGYAAGYRPDKNGNYAFAPADVAPPVVKAVTVTATAAQQPPVPVTACVTYNDFAIPTTRPPPRGKVRCSPRSLRPRTAIQPCTWDSTRRSASGL